MHLVLAAMRAELLQFNALGHRLLILGARVVSSLALSALESDNFARHRSALPTP
jgi:hypothetical protein